MCILVFNAIFLFKSLGFFGGCFYVNITHFFIKIFGGFIILSLIFLVYPRFFVTS